MVVVLAAVGQEGKARPQGSLPIPHLVPPKNIQVHPENKVTQFDQTRDTPNGVNVVNRAGSSIQGSTDDVTFQFPSGAIRGSLAVSQGEPSFPAGAPSFNSGFETSGFPTDNNGPDLPFGALGSDDVQFRIPGPTSPNDGSHSTGIGLSLATVNNHREPSVSSVGNPVLDDVQFTFPDTPTIPTNGPFPSEQDPRFSLSSQSKTFAGDTSVSSQNDAFRTGLESALTDLLLLSVDNTADQTFLDLQVPNQDNFPSSPPLDLGAELQSILDFTPTPGIVTDVPQRSLGDGNRKSFKSRQNQENELLSLLTLGLLGNRQGVSSRAQNNPIQELLAPLKKLFNLLTLGIFDKNSSSSSRSSSTSQLDDLLGKVTLGLLGNRNIGASGKSSEASLDQGLDPISSLVQIASSGLDNIAREKSGSLRLIGDEIQYSSREKVRKFIRNLQQAGSTLGSVGQNTYRSTLQKQDAISKLLMGLVENLGVYAHTSVGQKFDTINGGVLTIGRFIHDMKVGLLNALIAKGEAIRDLISGSLKTSGSAFEDFTKAAQGAAEDNIRAITGIKNYR